MNSEKKPSSHPTYRNIYIWLLILLAISIWGPVLALEIENRTVLVCTVLFTAFGIGIIKAGMVATWFMHLDSEKKFIARLLIVCLVFMVLLFAGVAPDVLLPKGQNRDLDSNYQYPSKKIVNKKH